VSLSGRLCRSGLVNLPAKRLKAKSGIQKRRFNTAKFGTTENLLRFMTRTLRQGVSKLINLSPTLTEGRCCKFVVEAKICVDDR
jgi:hypothetical protein